MFFRYSLPTSFPYRIFPVTSDNLHTFLLKIGLLSMTVHLPTSWWKTTKIWQARKKEKKAIEKNEINNTNIKCAPKCDFFYFFFIFAIIRNNSDKRYFIINCNNTIVIFVLLQNSECSFKSVYDYSISSIRLCYILNYNLSKKKKKEWGGNWVRNKCRWK